jgi:hypothetical protein
MLVVMGIPSFVRGCGFEWSPVLSRYSSVDMNGYVFYRKILDYAKISEKQDIPVFIVFRSNKEASDQSMGSGWSMPIIDSRIVQIDKDLFDVFLPNGNSIKLQRESVFSDTIKGNEGWAGKLNQDNTLISHQCGWSFRYVNGLISVIKSPTGKQFQIYRNNDMIISVLQDDVEILRIKLNDDKKYKEVDIRTDIATFEKYSFEYDNKPLITKAYNANIVDSISQSLSKIKYGTLEIENYVYNDGKELKPMLRVSASNFENSSQMHEWDVLTKKVIRINEWKYNINVDPPSIYSFARTSDRGVAELWACNYTSGIEQVQTLGGPVVEKRFFVTGILNGKTRLIKSTFPNGATNVDYSALYDEVGRLIRETKGNGGNSYVYDEKGGVKVFDLKGNIIYSAFKNGNSTKITRPGGEIIDIEESDGDTKFVKFQKNGKTINLVQKGDFIEILK